MFEIKLDKQPERFLIKCEDELFQRIERKLKFLKQNPIPSNTKKIVGYKLPTFRLRIGKQRILYRINHQDKLIIVIKIDKRSKVYWFG